MRISIRLFRKPLFTIIWVLILTITVLFLNLGINLYYSSIKTDAVLSSKYTTVAVPVPMDKISRFENGKEGVTIKNAQYPTKEEIGQISSMNSVEFFDVRRINAAYSPRFAPVISIQTEGAYKSYYDSPFNSVLMSVTLLENHFGEGFNFGFYEIEGQAQIEEIFSIHDGYQRKIDKIKIDWVSPEKQELLEVGKTYLIYGNYIAYDLYPPIEEVSSIEEMLPVVQISDHFSVITEFHEDGTKTYQIGKQNETPTIARLDCSLEEFLERSENKLWKQYTEELKITTHSLPLIGTDCLESMYSFAQQSAKIVQGRKFTKEEYKTGEKVCIISEAIAKGSGLSIGDEILISQYECLQRSGEQEIVSGSNPQIFSYHSENGFLTQEEKFTVVGIYHLENYWSDEAYAFTPNTIFAPKKALAGENRLNFIREGLGIFASIKLKNGAVDQFLTECIGTEFEEKFICFDGGYESIFGEMHNLLSSSKQFLVLSIGCWLLILVLFLILYQNRERRNLGIMRSLGASKRQTFYYLFGSGSIVAGIAVSLGMIPTRYFIEKVIESLRKNSVLENEFQGVFQSAGLQNSSEQIFTLLREGKMSPFLIFLCGIVQFGVIAVFLFLSSKKLTQIDPRKLLSEKGGKKG